MLEITSAFAKDGQIIGAIVHNGTKRDATRARTVLKREIAPRHEMVVHGYETMSLGSWLYRGQLLEVDVGLDIVKS